MAYADDESGIATGDVVELYDFTGPSASYRYTSARTDQTYLGDTYEARPGVERSSFSPSTSEETARLSMTIDAAADVVVAFGRGNPLRSLRLRVYRRQAVSGETRQWWDGSVTSIVTRGRNGIATIESEGRAGARLEVRVPGLTVLSRCQHQLYDEACGVDPDDFDHATTVVSTSGVSVTVASVGGRPDGWFANSAEIRRDVDGERRTIVRQVGAVLTLSSPFTTLNASDAVTMWAGCDHRYTVTRTGPTFADWHCITKFGSGPRGNIDNYGGHPQVPSRNPFTSSVKE